MARPRTCVARAQVRHRGNVRGGHGRRIRPQFRRSTPRRRAEANGPVEAVTVEYRKLRCQPLFWRTSASELYRTRTGPRVPERHRQSASNGPPMDFRARDASSPTGALEGQLDGGRRDPRRRRRRRATPARSHAGCATAPKNWGWQPCRSGHTPAQHGPVRGGLQRLTALTTGSLRRRRGGCRGVGTSVAGPVVGVGRPSESCGRSAAAGRDVVRPRASSMRGLSRMQSRSDGRCAVSPHAMDREVFDDEDRLVDRSPGRFVSARPLLATSSKLEQQPGGFPVCRSNELDR